MGSLWSIATILGPILLAGAIVYALMRNRRHETPEDVARTEAATHRLYEQQDAADHALEEKVER